MSRTVITQEIGDFIRKNYLKMSGMEIADRYGISKGAVYRFKRINGLEVPRELWLKWASEKTKRPLTEKEIEFIHDNIRDKSIKAMAREMKRTAQLISETAKNLGYAELIIQRAEDSRLKKGNIPSNKGKKMSAALRERTRHTWFKKGHVPANIKEDGAISVRVTREGEYRYIRISPGEWIPLHRYLWEEANGPIPQGMNIVFRDGDTLNCGLDNLEMIDNAENMLRNTIQNYPEELRTTMRLVKKITKKIEQKTKNT